MIINLDKSLSLLYLFVELENPFIFSPVIISTRVLFKKMKWIIGLFVLIRSELSIPSPLAEWQDEESTKSGPTVHVQIPTAIQQKGRQFNKLEMAKRIAAARHANKELMKVEGRQLSWESKLIPDDAHDAPIPVVDGEGGVSFENQEQMTDSLPDIKRYVHLDMSVAPVSRAYLIDILNLLAKNGVGGVIIEYGATFPYNGALSSLRADIKLIGDKMQQTNNFAYTIDDIHAINDAASNVGLNVIPLLDLCSNAGFVLVKMEKLKVEEAFIQDFNPLSIEVRVTLERMVKQILEIHSKSGHFHLGTIHIEYYKL